MSIIVVGAATTGHLAEVSLYQQFFKLYFYVAAKATYIRLLHGKIGIFWGFFGPSSVHRGRTHIVLR